jgi:FkbM family methyltransferase
MVLQADEVVEFVYELLLKRKPEPAALQHWSSALTGGLTQDQFVQAVLGSSEFRHQLGTADAHDDVDLVIPMMGRQLRVPACDRDLVPTLLRDRKWEPHLTRYLLRELRPSDIFLDAGANLGYFTVLCAPLVDRVIGFEPVARTHHYCQLNIALNALHNVELHRFGLWHEDATLSMRGDSVGVNAAIAPSAGVAGIESVRGVSLDGLIEGGSLRLPRLDVIKMDVEGAELSALNGMRATIERHRPKIVMEVNPPMLATFGVTIDDVWQFLRARGYRIHAFEPWQERDPFPVPDLDDLRRLCTAHSLIDIVALR